MYTERVDRERLLPAELAQAEFPELQPAAEALQGAVAEFSGRARTAVDQSVALSFPEIAEAPAALEAAARSLIAGAISKNTHSVYKGALKRLGEWMANYRRDALDDATLALYLVHLYTEDKSPSVAAQAVTAVTFQAKLRGQPSPAGPRTQLVLAGYRRKGRKRGRGQTTGINWAQADAAAALAADGSCLGARDAAILAVMSDGLLRASETAALLVADVAFHPDDTARLFVEASKTDPEGEGTVLFLGAPTAKRLRAWLAWVDAKRTEPLFQRLDRAQRPIGPMSRQTIYKVVRSRAAAAGIEGGVGSHSLRVGSAQSLAAAGASVVEMQTVGRWKSPTMPARYARAERAGRNAVARLRYGRPSARR